MKSFVNFTMFKSGTHYLRETIFHLTQKHFIEPKIIPGKNNYEDQNKFFIPSKSKHFFSWHLFPYEKTINFLQENKIKTICLVRNIFDQTYSIYNHFKLNIDYEIKRGRNIQDIFESLSVKDGINLIINGTTSERFNWKGSTHQLKHLETLYSLKEKVDTCFITYEELTFQQKKTIQKLIDFLDLKISTDGIEKIIKNTDIQKMQKVKINKSHFTNIQKKSYLNLLESDNFLNIESLINQKHFKLKENLEKEGYGYLVNKEKLLEFNQKFRH